jgi:hypothetical protein
MNSLNCFCRIEERWKCADRIERRLPVGGAEHVCKTFRPCLGGFWSRTSILLTAEKGNSTHKSTARVLPIAAIASHLTDAPNGSRKTTARCRRALSFRHHFRIAPLASSLMILTFLDAIFDATARSSSHFLALFSMNTYSSKGGSISSARLTLPLRNSSSASSNPGTNSASWPSSGLRRVPVPANAST